MKDGGPAFPSMKFLRGPNGDASVMMGGMSLRDWLAGQALQGLITPNPWGAAEAGKAYWAVTVQTAYACADAMLAEREKQ